VTSPGRLLADVDALLVDLLIPALDLGDGHVGDELPADYLNQLPFALAYRWGGQAVHPEFLDIAVCDVHLYAATKTEALDLSESARSAIYAAWKQQTVFDHGSIASYGEQAAPAVLRQATQPDRLTVVQATYRLGVCPPAQQP
jgi:hypothetical protein